MNQRMWWGGALAALWFAAAPAWSGEPESSTAPEAADADEGDMADAMFDFLMAEVAAQRGDLQGALGIYQRLARDLKDPRVARRAVEAAIRAHDYPAAMDSGALLLELDPESSLAREILGALLGNEGDLSKATETVSRLLDKSHDRAGMLTQLAFLFGKFQDKAAVLEATRNVTAAYPAMPEAHYALGVAALVANRIELAGQEADAAIAARPGWEQGAILKAQVLRKVDAHAVGPFYESFVAKHPASPEVRMQLGRELAGDHKLAEAREEFRLAEKLMAKDPQPAYAIGLLSLQLEDFAEAQAAFTRALKLGYRDPAAIYLGMGQASEGLKRIDEAIGWYQKVESGDWVRAQLKIATLISKQQGLAAGREYLHRIEPRSDDDKIQMVQVEAQLLRDAKAWRETYEMLSKAVEQYPDSFEILYDRAMAAERVDKLDVLEADLRKVIKMKPDYAHAYNALGYTLAEKTDRLSEAKDLIEKAFQLMPDDPFIQDSLGWVQYRLGEVKEALKNLQGAYTSRPDPEIAAHLGEVLWKSGNHDEARKVWQAALHENPNHETLLAVMQKFQN